MRSRVRKTGPHGGQPKAGGKDFRELVRAVYHRRRLASGNISAAQFERILESARWTPSVANRQPWLLGGANGESARELLQEFAKHPGSFVDFFSSTSGSDVTQDFHAAGAMVLLLGQRTSPFWRESCLLATYHLLLAATAENLAARALTPASPNLLASMVRVPEEYLAFMVVLLGHAGEPEIETRMLKPITEISVPLAPPKP